MRPQVYKCHEKCRFGGFSSPHALTPAYTRGEAGLPMLETARRLRPARMGVDVNEDHLAVVITERLPVGPPGFKLKLSAFSSAGCYEDRGVKLAKPHSR
jgi:hypothetical protein